MPKNMRGKYDRKLAALSVIFLISTGCGYSQDAWDQKVRRNGELREELAAAERARAQAENDYADALEELERIEQAPVPLSAPPVEVTQPPEHQERGLPYLNVFSDALSPVGSIDWQLKQSSPSIILSSPLHQILDLEAFALSTEGVQLLTRFAQVIPANEAGFRLTFRLIRENLAASESQQQDSAAPEQLDLEKVIGLVAPLLTKNSASLLDQSLSVRIIEETLSTEQLEVGKPRLEIQVSPIDLEKRTSPEQVNGSNIASEKL